MYSSYRNYALGDDSLFQIDRGWSYPLAEFAPPGANS